MGGSLRLTPTKVATSVIHEGEDYELKDDRWQVRHVVRVFCKNCTPQNISE